MFGDRGSSPPHRLLRQVACEAIESITSGVLVCGMIRGTQRVQHRSGRGLNRVRASVLSKKRGLIPVRSRRMRCETFGGVCGHGGDLCGDDARAINIGNYPHFA